MGVHNLWKLLEPAGRPTALDTLTRESLAIDASIWLYQFQQAMRDRRTGEAMPNAHLLGFLRRIVKLLFFGIRPVFVFDGPAPALKKKVTQKRRERREGALQDLGKVAHKILTQRIRQALERRQRIEAGELNPQLPDIRLHDTPTKTTRDQYELPALDRNIGDIKFSQDDLRMATEEELGYLVDELKTEDIDVDSESFKALPNDVQYELVHELRMRSRQVNRARVEEMRHAPTALDFSMAQIKNLKERNYLTQRVLQILGLNANAVVQMDVGRVAGFRNRQYVLIKKSAHEGGGWVLSAQRPESVPEDQDKKPAIDEPDNDITNVYSNNFVEEDLVVSSGESDSDNDNLFEPVAPDLVSPAKKGTFRPNFERRALKMVGPDTDTLVENTAPSQPVSAQQETVAFLSDSESDVDLVPVADVHDGSDVEVVEREGANVGEKSLQGGPMQFGPVEPGPPQSPVELEPVEPSPPQSPVEFEPVEPGPPQSPVELEPVEPHPPQSPAELEPVEPHPPPSPVEIETVQEPHPPQSPVEIEPVQEPQEAPLADTDAGPSKERPADEAPLPPKEIPASPEKDHLVSEPSLQKPGPLREPSQAPSKHLEPPRGGEAVESPVSPTTEVPQDTQDTVSDWDETPPGTPRETNAAEAEDALDHMESEEAQFERLVEELQVTGSQRRFRPTRGMESRERARVLEDRRQRALRGSEEITDEMLLEVKELLHFFGVPYVEAPEEAEAECASLRLLGLVSGIVTDDSDVFLFGGDNVYRHVFDQNKYVEAYTMAEIQQEMGLDRDKMIELAFLLGSDYEDGLAGVGPVLAMEILHDFPGKDGLKHFKEWWDQVCHGDITEDMEMTLFQRRFIQRHKRLVIDRDWPNPAVQQAYEQPVVTQSREEFSWGGVDLDGLRIYLFDMLGWEPEETNGLVLPLIKKQREKLNRGPSSTEQTLLTAYFDRAAAEKAPLRSTASVKRNMSDRLQRVVQSWRKAQSTGVYERSPMVKRQAKRARRPAQTRKRARRTAGASEAPEAPDEAPLFLEEE